MNSPFDTGGFSFGLEFKSLGFPDIYKTTEFVGFDASTFTIKQDDGRFGRDVAFGNEDTTFDFYDINVERDISQIQEPNGRVSVYLDMGLKWILETDNRFGYEGEVYFHLFKDGMQFTVGRLDFSKRETDGYTYFKCKILQNNKVELYKKNLSTSVDLFSTKGILDQNITPAPTLKVLRKAVPINKTSEWNCLVNTIMYSDSRTNDNNLAQCFFNQIKNITRSEINNTLTFFNDYIRKNSVGGDYDSPLENFCIIKAQKKLLNVKATIDLDLNIEVQTDNGVSSHGRIIGMFIKGTSVAPNFNTANEFRFVQSPLIGTDGSATSWSFNQNVDISFGDLQVGECIYFFFTQVSNYYNLILKTTFNKALLSITTSETAFDTVIPMVRYIDVLKQCSKFYNDLPVNAPIFDIGGEYYNNACWNRALISMQTSNSLDLISITEPNGETGQVINNTNINGTLALGLYFWNGTNWIKLDDASIPNLSLTSETTPSGTLGELINNTNNSIIPFGLCYWNGTSWQGLEYTKPFITSFEDAFSKSMTIEICGDYEIKNDEIFVGEYQDFYTNNEIAQFTIIPSEEFLKINNDRFLINNIKFGFDTYDTNRLTQNSAKDIFTQAEWNNPNQFVENKFDRSIKYIRSGVTAQVMVDLETNTPQTANENDDKVFINSIVPLPTGQYFEEQITLLMQTFNGQVQILNKSLNQSTSDVIINWLNLGLNVGDSFQIVSGDNSGTYTVASITQTILTLNPVGFTPTFTGDSNIKIKFFYTGIIWQTETNQIVNVVSGLDAADKYPNLNYSLRRIFERWKPYFASANLYHQNGKIRNLKFVNNPTLKSQIGTDPILEEKGDVLVSDLGTPIITSTIYKLTTTCSFIDFLNYLNAYKVNRGFVRCWNSNAKKIILGYAQEPKYTWATKQLELTLEEKFEPQTIIITFSSGILTVNDVVYNISGVLNWWKITGDYFQCFDSNNIPLCNIRRFNQVSYNGVIYTNANDLSIALTT